MSQILDKLLRAPRFAELGNAFFTPLGPKPLTEVHRVAHSLTLARELGLSPGWAEAPDNLALLSGQRPPGHGQSLASVYSGHQFGQWAGQLGDGRALLLGEVDGPSGPLELQLKGAGLTPYSRMGDGRAVLRSSIREFLASEAMHALGIPTSRALYLSGASTPVYREQAETAAVVTRVAPSFIRFGHFEHFAHSHQHPALLRLADFVLAQYFPELIQGDGNPYAALLAEVTRRSAALVADWQAVGFCHGVLNTDNMSILGLTLDYGPFQFLDQFDPDHICNHSDQGGRYAYQRQPSVVHWNLFCLGQALLPLLPDQELALAALAPFKDQFSAALQTRLAAKLGWVGSQVGDTALVERLQQLLADDGVDYPRFWRALCDCTEALGLAAPQASPAWLALRALFVRRDSLEEWLQAWQDRLRQQPNFDPRASAAAMRRRNPQVVLRNHLGELAIRAAQDGDFSVLHRLHAALERPFEAVAGEEDLSALPPAWAGGISISCSS